MAPVPEPGATPPGTTFKRPRGRPRKNAEAVAEQDLSCVKRFSRERAPSPPTPPSAFFERRNKRRISPSVISTPAKRLRRPSYHVQRITIDIPPPMLADTSSPPPMSFNRPRGRPRKVVDVKMQEIDTTGSTSSTRPVVAGPTRPSGQRSRGGRKRRVHSAPAKRTKEDEKHDKNGQETMEIDDEDDEEDEKYDEYLLKECTEKVMDHFRKVQEHYRKRIKEEAAPEFKRAISSLPIRSYHTYNNVQPVPLHLHEEDPEQFADTAKVSDRRNGSTQRCGVRWLPAVELRPRTAYWVHTEYNVKADEEHRLSHIPFISEDHDDKKFCNELRKLYDEGIHGADTGCGEYINDYMMFHLLDSLKSEWEDKGPEVMEHFYYSIFKLFPNKLSHRQLVYARADLEERFAPDRMPSKSAQEMRSRKDNEFHSVSVLMCGKCHQYDCLLHGACEEEKMRMKRKPGLRVDSEEPCGPDCYMNDPRAQALRVAFDRESNGEIPTIPNLPGQTPTAPPLPYRNPSVMNIFRTLISSDKVNICEVARHMVMITQDIGHPIKSCKELFHLSITFPRSRRDVSPEMKKVSDRDKHRSFRSFTWADGKGQVDNSTRMVPCKHSGVCGPSTDCRCFQKNGICNKYCSCGPECKMKFPGCRCQPGACRTKQCQCFYAKWECDPDVCKSCKCDDLDPNADTCRNVSLQRGFQKKLKVGISGIAGWGCFIDEEAEKGDLVAEYTGEVVTKWEAERRGVIYDKFRTSYIFSLNAEQFIDATRVGNLIRFANHSDNNSNCYSQIIIVNGEHRIGVFAKRRLQIGEELLFDYHYDKSWKEQFVPIEKAKSQLTRCTPESDSSRTSVNGSQSKEEELRKAVLKKATNGNIKSGASGTRGKGRKRKI